MGIPRSCAFIVLVGAAVACDRGVGYRRPEHRNIGAIGSPQVTVGTNGLEHGEGESPGIESMRNEVASKLRVESGQVAGVRGNAIKIATDSGDTLELGLKPMTTVTLNGRPAHLAALPEGADVRASYVETDSGRVAEKIDVYSKKVPQQ